MKDIQRVICGLQGTGRQHDTASEYKYFTLRFLGSYSLPIYAYYASEEIKQAIEYSPYIGNVTIVFPHYSTDNISTACHTNVNEAYGGFLVIFDTEFGNLPLLEPSTYVNITVSKYRSGNSVSRVIHSTVYLY